jgi:hypothetical protein
MSNTIITVWNASTGVLKIGENKNLLKPAETVDVAPSGQISALINDGKLAVVEIRGDNFQTEEDAVEPSSRKKTKKDTVVTESEEEAETPVSAENEDNPPAEANEVVEDSILPEETV